LEKEGALAMIICAFSDAPSQVAQELHPCLVDRSHGLDCDRHKQVGLAEYSIFAWSHWESERSRLLLLLFFKILLYPR